MKHTLKEEGFRYGIEYEFALLNRDRKFVDFSNTSFEQLDAIISRLPTYESDYPGLRVGDLGIKAKRWYIEGFERFDEKGKYLRTDIKGMEIRTPISRTIDEAVGYIETDLALFSKEASRDGYHPVMLGLNPNKKEFMPTPPLNDWEVIHRSSPEEQTAYIHMLTYGPDVSISHDDLTADETIEAARKLTYYSPYIVPYSFSSPFYNGELWGGLSRRTYYRTGRRPAALAFLANQDDLIASKPTLTEIARVPAEAGRIEFKAFDSVANPRLYGALLTLVKGILLDETLDGRATVPDRDRHRQSAQNGFNDDTIYEQAKAVMAAAKAALSDDDSQRLEPLEEMLASHTSPADEMIARYSQDPDIITLLENYHGPTI
jgi:gamma-glutamyl:cysteine ligase YbdK (ATP-grasp superfamily)